MIIQAFLLIAVIVVITGSILSNSLVTARAGLAQSVQAESRAAMSDATADFVTWARGRVGGTVANSEGNAQTSWAPKIIAGKDDTKEFKAICSSTTAQVQPPLPACAHYEHVTWMVLGGTTAGSNVLPPNWIPSQTQEAEVRNLARTVDEQRISAILSVDVQSADGLITYSSQSREVTARIFDALPYVAITGSKDLNAIQGAAKASEGDSGGFSYKDFLNYTFYNTRPTISNPAKVVDTRIITQVNCSNSSTNINRDDPRQNPAQNLLINPRKDGNLQWAFELACIPKNPPAVDLPAYIAPQGDVYATVDDSTSKAIPKRDTDESIFAH